MKKYSQTEGQTFLQSQLYSFEQSFKTSPDIIHSLCDLLPGVILINDCIALKNTYMNVVGRNFLRKEQEELNSMETGYFVSEFFDIQEMQWIASTFDSLVKRNDKMETIGFYQKVRPGSQSPWQYYYLSGKIMESMPGCCIYMGIPMPYNNYLLNRIGNAIDAPNVDPEKFQKFSSMTKREKEILSFIAKGYTTQKISDILYVSKLTVDTHRKNIRRKLDVKHLRDMILFAEHFKL